ncbi:Thoeris anti-defense Tad2 family protein [Limosilactobacillus reuteri]|uniref:Thoeris anti-defense Tad2 family protein n=1 Tax=Limosilactobacillus reuteri TaxID=1598 RepID=UPI002B05D1F0|nr:MW1434 family type I TA system toxin [Limosilactobacillus reuteri]
MNIVEATKKADSNHAIRRKSWVSQSMMLIPTDTTFLTSIIFNKDVVNVRWEPSKEDLIADDWDVVLISLDKLFKETKNQLTKSEFYRLFNPDALND